MNKELAHRVEIIAVGSELLTPHYQDTNSLYLTARLNDIGWTVSFKTIVGDDVRDLSSRVRQALRSTELVMISGGLGPTGDDVTREAVARALGRDLILQRDLLEQIRERFRRRRRVMPKANRRQAFVIRGAAVLPNPNGTAPGQLIRAGGKRIFLLPGPPHELKTICEASVWPELERERRRYLSRSVLKVTGLTESMVEDLISGLYPRTSDLGLTVLASPGQVEVHLLAASTAGQARARAELRRFQSRLLGRLKDYVFSAHGESLEQVVGALLREKKMTLAAAESCSGGLISHRLTNVPGSSDYFLEGVIAYSNAAKVGLLAVPREVIETHGAVSHQVGRAMALGVRKRARADIGLAVTGIAGPTGGTAEKPVGLVFTALSSAGVTEVEENLFLGTREQIKFQSAQKALDMVRRHLLSRAGARKRRSS